MAFQSFVPQAFKIVLQQRSEITFDKIQQPVQGNGGRLSVVSEFIAYLIGIVVTLGLIYLLGILVEAVTKNRWNVLVDNIMDRLPLISTVYNAMRKLMHMFEYRDQSELKAMSAVICHLGGTGGTAVLALMPSPQRIRMHEREYYGILIPTAPMPFGGAILYVPAEWVEPVDMAFDEMFNVYMSMGATSADYLHQRIKPDLKQRNSSDDAP